MTEPQPSPNPKVAELNRLPLNRHCRQLLETLAGGREFLQADAPAAVNLVRWYLAQPGDKLDPEQAAIWDNLVAAADSLADGRQVNPEQALRLVASDDPESLQQERLRALCKGALEVCQGREPQEAAAWLAENLLLNLEQANPSRFRQSSL